MYPPMDTGQSIFPRFALYLLKLRTIQPAKEALQLIRQDFTNAVYRNMAGGGDFFLILSLAGQADYSLCQLDSLGPPLSPSLGFPCFSPLFKPFLIPLSSIASLKLHICLSSFPNSCSITRP